MDEQETPEQKQHKATREEAMLLALEDSYGIVTPAARLVGIDRCTHYRWLKEDKDYREAVEDLDNVSLDHTESKLKELIDGVTVEGGMDLTTGETTIYKKEPNVTAVIFHLKTKGKKRGYVEKTEIDLSGKLKQEIKTNAIDFSKMSDEELSRYKDLMMQAAEIESQTTDNDSE